MPNKLLGQNFLKNAAVLQKIIAAVDVEKGDAIFEIGPGHGELTLPLAKACGAVGARLVAIEKDAALADAARNAMRAAGIENAEIVTGDALQFFNSDAWRPPADFKIAGNIPYYLTGHLLRVISELPEYPARCVFLVQKEVAERMAADAGDMNRLAASVQFWAEPRIITRVSRRDFHPQPKVDSAVVVLDRKKAPAFRDADGYFRAVRALFAQPRKTLVNNLAAALEKSTKDDLAKRLADLGIDPRGRPQDLSIAHIADIADAIF